MNVCRILAAGVAALALGSCSTVTHTSQTAPVDTGVYNLTVADMEVSGRRDSVTVDWNWNPLSTVSLKAQKESATYALLDKNGADVLVEPQYIVRRRGIFRGGSVTVTGYPASYGGFRAMSMEDAEKIAVLDGKCSTVAVNPLLSVTSGKVPGGTSRPRTIGSRGRSDNGRHGFVNILGGGVIDASGNVDTGYQLGLMFGSCGTGWGWYGKVALNRAVCYDYHSHGSLEDKGKWTPTFTFGAVKTIYKGFGAFAGIGVGGYFTMDEGYDDDYDSYGYGYYYSEDVAKFSIPVDFGFMMRIKRFNVLVGATYATPLGGGSGNVNPFAGIGLSF